MLQQLFLQLKRLLFTICYTDVITTSKRRYSNVVLTSWRCITQHIPVWEHWLQAYQKMYHRPRESNQGIATM